MVSRERFHRIVTYRSLLMPSDGDHRFGSILRRYRVGERLYGRTAKSVTQAALASKIPVSPSRISQWENNGEPPADVHVIVAIRDKLLLGEKEHTDLEVVYIRSIVRILLGWPEDFDPDKPMGCLPNLTDDDRFGDVLVMFRNGERCPDDKGKPRRAPQMTQKALAARLGITSSAVSQWETGKTLPTNVATIQRIAQALELNQKEAEELMVAFALDYLARRMRGHSDE